VAVNSLNIRRRDQFTASRTINLLFVLQSSIVVDAIVDLKITSVDNLCHKARQFNTSAIVVVPTFIVKAVSLNRYIGIKVAICV
jgi:uncharacterized protein with FMN-binding domain